MSKYLPKSTSFVPARTDLAVKLFLRDHNFLFGSSTTTRLNYANTCSLNSASSLTLTCLLEVGHPPGLLDHNSRIREFRYKRLVVQVTTRFAVGDFFFLGVVSRKKEEKSSTIELAPRGVQDSPLSFFCPTRVAQFRKAKDFFCRRATYKGSGSTGKPRKPLSPPVLVYRRRKGT